MIETSLVLAAIAAVIFVAIVLGAVAAGIYDAWYRRKYAVWLALQEDHNYQKKPAAK